MLGYDFQLNPNPTRQGLKILNEKAGFGPVSEAEPIADTGPNGLECRDGRVLGHGLNEIIVTSEVARVASSATCCEQGTSTSQLIGHQIAQIALSFDSPLLYPSVDMSTIDAEGVRRGGGEMSILMISPMYPGDGSDARK